MRAIVFDLDGTLIDSAPDINRIANIVLAGAGADGLNLAETHSFIGHGSGVFVSKMMAARGLGDNSDTHAQLHAHFENLYETATDLSVLYPNVLDTLERLKQAGFMLGLCTNKPISPTHAVLAHFALSDFFDVVLGGDSLPQRKPDPAPLIHVFSQLGTTGGLYVGDSEVDAETAQRAGQSFALFSEGYRKSSLDELPHDYVFSDFSKLWDIVQSHFKAG